MAKQTIMVLTDDLDGTDAEETITFGFDGTAYEIDLSDINAQTFRKLMEPYLAAGTRKGKIVTSGSNSSAWRPGLGASATSPAADKQENVRIRQWANNNGYSVSERGRIPQSVIDAYRQQRPAAPASRLSTTDAATPKDNGNRPGTSAALFSEPVRQDSGAPVAAGAKPRRRTTRTANA